MSTYQGQAIWGEPTVAMSSSMKRLQSTTKSRPVQLCSRRKSHTPAAQASSTGTHNPAPFCPMIQIMKKMALHIASSPSSSLALALVMPRKKVPSSPP